jgi:hypothetical protein
VREVAGCVGGAFVAARDGGRVEYDSIKTKMQTKKNRLFVVANSQLSQ